MPRFRTLEQNKRNLSLFCKNAGRFRLSDAAVERIADCAPFSPPFSSFSWLATRWVNLCVLIVETGHDEIKPSILSQLDDERQSASAAIQRVVSQDKEGKPLQIFFRQPLDVSTFHSPKNPFSFFRRSIFLSFLFLRN